MDSRRDIYQIFVNYPYDSPIKVIFMGFTYDVSTWIDNRTTLKEYADTATYSVLAF